MVKIMTQQTDLTTYLDDKRQLVEQALETCLPPADTLPPTLHEAMRYSTLAGGKRLRPVMLLMTAELFERDCRDMAFAAAALEIVHTYSLIHDDLPAMDNDDLRRGRPTNHKVYGEAMAILAGDALLTLAFQIMSDPTHLAKFDPAAMIHATHELALAAGSTGMVGGQALDMQSEQRQISLTELEAIHHLKTGKMIAAAMRIGAFLSDARPEDLGAVTHYGELVGLAFQIMDDILDIEGTAEELGKNPASDLQRQKATYPALHGLAQSKILVEQLIKDAIQALHLFGDRAYYLIRLAEYMRSRTN